MSNATAAIIFTIKSFLRRTCGVQLNSVVIKQPGSSRLRSQAECRRKRSVRIQIKQYVLLSIKFI